MPSASLAPPEAAEEEDHDDHHQETAHAATMEIVEQVLVGKINPDLVATINSHPGEGTRIDLLWPA